MGCYHLFLIATVIKMPSALPSEAKSLLLANNCILAAWLGAMAANVTSWACPKTPPAIGVMRIVPAVVLFNVVVNTPPNVVSPLAPVALSNTNKGISCP